MKTKLVTFLLFIVITTPAFSQWGIKGGLNYSDIAQYQDASYRLGAHLGITFDKALSANWYFQPGLLFTSYGTNLKAIPNFAKSGHVVLYGFEVPLNFSFRPSIGNNLKLLTEVGLYARYGLFGQKKYVYEAVTGAGTVNESPFDAYNRFDLGANLGIGIQKGSYSVSAAYLVGLPSAQKGMGLPHQMFRVSLGYQF
jgi:hypothetical protein